MGIELDCIGLFAPDDSTLQPPKASQPCLTLGVWLCQELDNGGQVDRGDCYMIVMVDHLQAIKGFFQRLKYLPYQHS